MYDQAVDQGADPQPFNDQPCMRSGMLLGSLWDAQHPSSAPVLARCLSHANCAGNVNGSRDIIAGKVPECGHRDTLCEVETEI